MYSTHAYMHSHTDYYFLQIRIYNNIILFNYAALP